MNNSTHTASKTRGDNAKDPFWFRLAMGVIFAGMIIAFCQLMRWLGSQ